MSDREPMDEIHVTGRLGSDVPEVDESAKERARLRLLRHIRASIPAPAPSRARRRRSGRWIVGAAAVAAGVLVLQALLPSGGGGPVPAQATLRRLAAVAASTPPLEVGPGEFLYTRSREIRRNTQEDLASGLAWSYEVPLVREMWVASDGSGRILTRFGEPSFLSPADWVAWQESGKPPLMPDPKRADEAFGPGELTLYDARALPTDAQELGGLIESREVVEGPPGDSGTLNIVGILLAETYSSAEIRAALFRVAAKLPTIELVGDTTDPLGRPGVAVGIAEDGIRTELIFDPQTARLLARQRVNVQVSPYEVLDWRAYQESGVVTSVDHRP